MTLPNSSSTSAVPYKSTLRIVAGDACDGETPAAWISPVTSPARVAVSTSACTASREDTSISRDAHVIAGVSEYLGSRVRVALLQICKHDMLAYCHAPRDCLTDLAGSDYDDDTLHGDSSTLMLRTETLRIAAMPAT